MLELSLAVEVFQLSESAYTQRLHGRRRGANAVLGGPRGSVLVVDSLGAAAVELLDPGVSKGLRGREPVLGQLLKHLLDEILRCFAHTRPFFTYNYERIKYLIPFYYKIGIAKDSGLIKLTVE